MLSVNFCGIYSAAPEKIKVAIEPVVSTGGEGLPFSYYRFELGGVSYTLTDSYRRQILDVLSSAPPLPKDAQIDAEDEESRGELPPYQHQEFPRG